MSASEQPPEGFKLTYNNGDALKRLAPNLHALTIETPDGAIGNCSPKYYVIDSELEAQMRIMKANSARLRKLKTLELYPYVVSSWNTHKIVLDYRLQPSTYWTDAQHKEADKKKQDDVRAKVVENYKHIFSLLNNSPLETLVLKSQAVRGRYLASDCAPLAEALRASEMGIKTTSVDALAWEAHQTTPMMPKSMLNHIKEIAANFPPSIEVVVKTKALGTIGLKGTLVAQKAGGAEAGGAEAGGAEAGGAEAWRRRGSPLAGGGKKEAGDVELQPVVASDRTAPSQ
jgi:hypothetical protein